MTGFRGTFVVSWSQTEIDGLAAAPVSSLEVGATWRWHGTPVRVDGPNDVLVLGGPEGEDELRRRAGRIVRRLVGGSYATPLSDFPDWDEPLFDRCFVVTDGLRSYPVTMIATGQLARPLLMFPERMPPRDREMWITHNLEDGAPQTDDAQPGVICFAEGTFLRTPDGPRAVETLAPGDRVETRDGGAQPVRWVGHRRISGARLLAMPELRPIRIRTGALGLERPTPDLIVSPQHRILVRDQTAQALFNTPEVLVAATDMVNDRTVTLDHGAREVVYHHIMLPEHHVVWANGVASESFHPAHAPLDTIEADQRAALFQSDPALIDDPLSFGAPARRMLTTAEAAIMLHEARGRARRGLAHLAS
ncbi:Hint domain-containing protein [Oceaniglobus trochenteri]|uniref:Hint domain-containing protein n=1 Tax=Oceaniglobus trochenteri TaxID=2763260 RepID=UPI001CFFFCC3|nr:Hint domain-containing protein [Oceaniglobus trochenteri]